MKNFFIKLPYRHRVAMVILFFALLPCIFMEIIYLKNIQQEWKQAAFSDYQSDIDSSALMMSQNITGLLSKLEYVRNNSSVRSSIAQINGISLVQALDLISLQNELVGSITADNPYLELRWYPHLSVISYGSYCYTLDIFAEEFPLGRKDPSFQEIIALNEGQLLWQVRNIARGANNTGAPEMRLCLYTQMMNLNGSGCVLEFSIPIFQMLESRRSDTVPESLFAICLESDDKPVNILLDSTFTPEESEAMITHYRMTGKISGYDILSTPIPNVANGKVIFILPTSYAQKQIRPQIIAFIAITVLLLFMIISASYLTSHLLTKRIFHAINTINNDLYHIHSESPNLSFIEDDIDQISQRVRKLVQDTQEYCAKLEHYEDEALRMELELLQMRFNPHLLYNTLGAIRYQVKSPGARSSIDSLCHYYRIVLNNGHLIIKIKDEFEMIKEYLSIEKFAYHLDNIIIEFEIDEQVAQYTIIKHLLQPIVENALNHGIRPSSRDFDGILRISATSENDCICIRITDNGVGMSPEYTAKLLSAPSASVSGHGYGIYNVQQRIQVYYGKEYGLQIHSTIGEGTAVTLRIPAIPSDEIPEL
ncbi:MAG: histidine kinase [Roseburia sp.]|nr:histidine kinase [Roseburia sp.]